MPATTTMTGTDSPHDHRHNNFDAIRFVLAASVIVSHSWDLLGRPNPFSSPRNQTALGSIAVDAFFIISGFLIAQSFQHSRTTLEYLWKRAVRILPAFVAAGLVSLLFFAPLPVGFAASYWPQIYWPGFFFRLLTVQSPYIPDTFTANHWPYVNSAIWTVHYEVVCYVLLVALGIFRLIGRRTILIAVGALMIVRIIYELYFPQLLRAFPENPLFSFAEWPIGGTPGYYPRFFSLFLAGTAFYLWRDRIRYTNRGALVAATALVLSMPTATYLVAMPAAGAYFIFWLSFTPSIPLQRFGRYGDFSYGMYVYGWPVQQTVIWLTGSRWPPLAVATTSIVIALGFAVVSWKLVEAPFLRLKPRRQPAAPAFSGATAA
jgi:peptidoglycan/LPS O-acetylase OafA/YrhL